MRRSIAAIGLLGLVFSTIGAVPEGQTLEATPTILTFTAVQGESNPVTPAVIFLNNNTRERNWVTSYNATWLSVTVSPAHLIPRDRLLVSANVAGLTAGVYTGTISIAGMKGEPVSIPVTLTITTRIFATPTLSPLSTTTTATLARATDIEPE